MDSLRYSFIIPVYNRPVEVEELLESLAQLNGRVPFEVVIVEDGSSITCKTICDAFSDQLNLNYYFKENSGPGDSRNYGMRKAKGNYFIIFDSDCIIPEPYLVEVNKYLSLSYVDCYGGPDTAHESFTPVQKSD